jgi:RecB family endonuclease NucS
MRQNGAPGVVVELKADWAGDDAVGQILGYMSWVRDNLPNGASVRGILVCKNATTRIQAAAKLVRLSIKRFVLNFSIEDVGATECARGAESGG